MQNRFNLAGEEWERYQRFMKIKSNAHWIYKALPMRGVDWNKSAKGDMARAYATREIFGGGPIKINDDDYQMLVDKFGVRS